jgi:hypothetical protein
MKPKNFPGRKHRRQVIALKWQTREDFNKHFPEIADTTIRLGKAKRTARGTV